MPLNDPECRCCLGNHDPTKLDVRDEDDLCERCYSGECPEFERRKALMFQKRHGDLIDHLTKWSDQLITNRFNDPLAVRIAAEMEEIVKAEKRAMAEQK